jgi:hypothetical protein
VGKRNEAGYSAEIQRELTSFPVFSVFHFGGNGWLVAAAGTEKGNRRSNLRFHAQPD